MVTKMERHHTNGQTGRQAGTQIDRHTYEQMNRYTDAPMVNGQTDGQIDRPKNNEQIYRRTNGKMDRHTDRRTNRQADEQTQRWSNGQA